MEAKSSIFVETFGETPIVKVLDFFLTFDSSITQKVRWQKKQ